jgi:hypothetical protein
MYERVYLGMVDAGVAVKLEAETMYNKEGDETTNITEIMDIQQNI